MSTFVEENRSTSIQSPPTVWDVVQSNPKLQSLSAVSTTLGEVLDYMQAHSVSTVALSCQPGAISSFISEEFVVEGVQYAGFLSIIDIFLYAMTSMESPENIMTTPAVYALGSSLEGMAIWIEPYTRLLNSALKQLTRGCHHALAYDTEHIKLSPKMLSQMDCVKYIYAHQDLYDWKDVMSMPLEQVMTAECKTIQLTDTLRDSFVFLQRYRALPVVDGNNRLITTLSISDFSGQNYLTLVANVDVEVFRYVLLRHDKCLPEPITLTPHQPLGLAMETMIKNKIHRVWIVSAETKKICGVVSCTDVLRKFYHEE